MHPYGPIISLAGGPEAQAAEPAFAFRHALALSSGSEIMRWSRAARTERKWWQFGYG